jgi:5,6,7,8-tetrahydromethanopterin hydro-lyase
MEMRVGEAMAGRGENRVHINLLLGSRAGPVGHAFATALASPRPGHVPFLVTLRPNVPVRPATLFVNKAEIRGEPHATISWGAGEAGIAEGVRAAIKDGALADHDLDELVMIVSIWIDWAATDEAAVLRNTREAMRTALLRADGREAYAGDFLDDTLDAFNTKFAMEE